MYLRHVVIAIVMLTTGMVSGLEAGQVTMAAYDFDGDYTDEIIRTDENTTGTVIKVYKRIENSFFYQPLQEFHVSGRLVQVPEITDVNRDGVKDYLYATGIDMGIIYFDFMQEAFIRTNDFNFDASVDMFRSEHSSVPYTGQAREADKRWHQKEEHPGPLL